MEVNINELFYIKEDITSALSNIKLKKGSIISIISYNTNTCDFTVFNASDKNYYTIDENDLSKLIEVRKSQD